MTISNFKDYIKKLDKEAVVIDNKGLDPIEVFVLSSKASMLKNKLKTLKYVEEGDFKRIIVILSTVNGDVKKFYSIAARSADRTLTGAEEKAFYEYCSDACGKKGGWLRTNVRQDLSAAEPINTASDRSFVFLFKRIRYRIFTKYTYLAGRRHAKLTRSAFLKRLIDSGVTSNKMKREYNAGSTGAIYIEDKEGDRTYFIKGNEFPPFCGISNEISLHKYLIDKGVSSPNILPMVDYDQDHEWIKYPYINCNNLTEYCEKKQLTDAEKDMLGKFLTDTLELLYENEVSHNDFRADNIMVDADENGHIRGFILIDFGCASINGSFPWEKYARWGRHFKQQAAGTCRYNDNIIDDAAAAYLVYKKYAGEYGDYAERIKALVGRSYMVLDEHSWSYVR